MHSSAPGGRQSALGSGAPCAAGGARPAREGWEEKEVGSTPAEQLYHFMHLLGEQLFKRRFAQRVSDIYVSAAIAKQKKAVLLSAPRRPPPYRAGAAVSPAPGGRTIWARRLMASLSSILQYHSVMYVNIMTRMSCALKRRPSYISSAACDMSTT